MFPFVNDSFFEYILIYIIFILMAVEIEKREGSMRMLIDFVVRNLAIMAFHTIICLILSTFISSASHSVI